MKPIFAFIFFIGIILAQEYHLVADLSDQSSYALLYENGVIFQNKLFFSALNITNQLELHSWSSPNITTSYGFEARSLIVYNNKLYFWNVDYSNYMFQMYVFDGVNPPVKKTNIPAPNGMSKYQYVWNSKLYTNVIFQNFGAEMNEYDDVTDTSVVIDIIPGVTGANPNYFIGYNSKLYFIAMSDGYKIYSYSTTDGGIEIVTNPCIRTIIPQFIVFQNLLYFIADDCFSQRYMIYAYNDVTKNITNFIFNSDDLFNSFVPMVIWENKLFFVGSSLSNGNVVYSFDGISITKIMYNITNPIRTIGIYNNKLFAGSDGEIYYYNKTGFYLNVLPTIPLTSIDKFLSFGGKLFFSASRNDVGYELFYYEEPSIRSNCECSNDQDCSGHGICIEYIPGNGGYCSCYSGFGGCLCDERPSEFCSFKQINNLKGGLNATVDIDYNYPNLNIIALIELEQNPFLNPAVNDDTVNVISSYSKETRIIFGNGEFPECNFPNTNAGWIDQVANPDCIDTYLGVMPWGFAKSSCGFQDTNGNRQYEQKISVQRKYSFLYNITRIDSLTQILRLIFPKSITVSSSNVQFQSPPFDTYAAISYIDYNPDTELWTVIVRMSTITPYLFTSAILGSLNSEINEYSRYENHSISIISGCLPGYQRCVQDILIIFQKGLSQDSCFRLFGTMNFNLTINCDDSMPQCEQSGEKTSLILELNTQNACPVIDNIEFTSSILESFSDPDLTTSESAFYINSPVYFGATITSDKALISFRNVTSVCAQDGANPCQPLHYTVLPSTNGKDPVFSVDFTNPSNNALFNFIGPKTLTFSANIDVDFTEAKRNIKRKDIIISSKLSIFNSIQTESTVESVTVKENQENNSQLTNILIFVGVGVGVVALVTLTVVVIWGKIKLILATKSTPNV